jgi:hypothetical protein
MSRHMTRRTILRMLGALGLGAFARPGPGRILAGQAADPAEATFAGSWTYRSFLSNPDINVDFSKLEFARAALVIDPTPQGVFRGKLSFDTDYLTLKGNVAYGNPFTARFQGRGATAPTEGWIYDYLGYLIPMWPDGVNQRPAIVGTVIRTVPHSDGKAKAGVVASFIAVKRDT